MPPSRHTKSCRHARFQEGDGYDVSVVVVVGGSIASRRESTTLIVVGSRVEAVLCEVVVCRLVGGRDGA